MKRKTRLQMLMEAPDEELDPIRDVLDKKLGEDKDELNLGGKKSSNVVQRVTKTRKFIKVEYMWNGDDFVWHVAPHPKKPWKVDASRLVLAIAQIMAKPLLKSKVDIWRPIPNMVPEYTFRAYGIRKNWALDEEKIHEGIDELLTELNNLV